MDQVPWVINSSGARTTGIMRLEQERLQRIISCGTRPMMMWIESFAVGAMWVFSVMAPAWAGLCHSEEIQEISSAIGCNEGQIKKAECLVLPEFIMFNVGIIMLSSSRVCSPYLFGIKLLGNSLYFCCAQNISFWALVGNLKPSV